MPKIHPLKHAKFVRSILKKWDSGAHTALDDHYNCAQALRVLSTNYLRLHRLAKDYLQKDGLENIHKLKKELGCE